MYKLNRSLEYTLQEGLKTTSEKFQMQPKIQKQINKRYKISSACCNCISLNPIILLQIKWVFVPKKEESDFSESALTENSAKRLREVILFSILIHLQMPSLASIKINLIAQETIFALHLTSV